MRLLLDLILAASPVLMAIICLICLKVSGMHTALLSTLLAFVISLVPSPFATPLTDLVRAAVQALLISSTIIYVLVFGLLLFNVLRTGGAIAAISDTFARLSSSPVEQALLISAALGPFLEATSGFGIGIVIAAPLYLALGFQPHRAALLSLLTQSAVPWGALAIGTVVNAELSHVPLSALGSYSAMVNIPLYFFYTIMVVVICGGRQAVKQNVGAIVLVASMLSITTWAISSYVSTELAGVFAGFISSLCLVVYWKSKSIFFQSSSNEAAVSQVDGRPNQTQFLKAIIPYVILTTYILISHLSTSAYEILTSLLSIRLPEYSFHLDLLYSPGFALLLASAAGMCLYKLPVQKIKYCFAESIRQVYPAAVATIGFVAMSTIMQRSGMTNLIAASAADVLGAWFILASPLIGAMGGFMSGSNSAANAMFSSFQTTMAVKLDHSQLLYATSQNVSASTMTMASPSRIALAAAITNSAGSEGRLVRHILPISLGALLIIMVCVFCLNRL